MSARSSIFGFAARRSALWSLALALGVVAGGQRHLSAQEGVITIRAVEGLRLDPVRIAVEPGKPVRLRFENADTTAQPHNLVVARPGTRAAVLAAALALGGEGPKREYVPETSDVLAATPVLAAGAGATLTFTLPESPAIYPIVCTFPGHGVLMYGALYAGVPMPKSIEADDHVPRPAPAPRIDPDPRPMVRRMFLPEASPAAIAVALPGEWNLCWDAGPCQLRYGWFGSFLDAERHFQGKGQALASLGGPVAWKAPKAFPLRIGNASSGTVAFRGYRLEKGVPVFEYTFDGQLVRERFSVSEGSLVRTLQLPGVRASVAIAVALEPLVPYVPDRGVLMDGILHLQPSDAEEILLRYSAKRPTPEVPR